MNRLETSRGAQIFRLPLRLFPTLNGYAHLIFTSDALVLVDTGSGLPESNESLLDGFRQVSQVVGREVTLRDVDLILITHGHIDHFGGLPFVREHTQAPVYVHALDHRVLTRFEERTAIATRDLDIFLRRAGVREERRRALLGMYGFARSFYRSVAVDGHLVDGMEIGGFRVCHVPGHCPGLVCLRLDDVLLVGDHVLPHTTPHLSPESITRYTGVGHYLASLDTLERESTGVRVALGGHEEAMFDLGARVQEIRRSIVRKLGQVLSLCAEPTTVVDISKHRYPDVHGYDVLLALLETGAYVEYLHEHGYVYVSNWADVQDDVTAPVHYQRAADAMRRFQEEVVHVYGDG